MSVAGHGCTDRYVSVNRHAGVDRHASADRHACVDKHASVDKCGRKLERVFKQRIKHREVIQALADVEAVENDTDSNFGVKSEQG